MVNFTDKYLARVDKLEEDTVVSSSTNYMPKSYKAAQEIEDLNSEISGIVSVLNTKLPTIDSQFSQHLLKITNCEAENVEIDNKISEISERITNITSSIISNNTSVDIKISDNSLEILNNKNDIANLNNSISAINTNMAANSESNDTKFNENTVSINTLNENVNSINSSISSLSNSIDERFSITNANVSSNDSDIAALFAKYNELERVQKNKVNNLFNTPLFYSGSDFEIVELATSIDNIALSSGIKVTITISGEADSTAVLNIKRNGEIIIQGALDSSSTSQNLGLLQWPQDRSISNTMNILSYSFIDKNPVIGLNTYTFHFENRRSTSCAINRTIRDNNSSSYVRATSSIILEEVML